MYDMEPGLDACGATAASAIPEIISKEDQFRVAIRHEAAHGSLPNRADADLAHREIGHLDGWGRGLFDGSGALYYTRTRGTTGARTLSWVVRGRGVLSLKIGSCRVGWTTREMEIS
jgi:hypothetical protein